MGRKPKRWSFKTGDYGERTRIYEPRLGAPLRWDMRSVGGGRPEVKPLMYVRRAPGEKVDAVLVQQAEELCKKKHAEIRLQEPEAEPSDDVVTLERAYAIYFNPRKKALPDSREARNHHEGSRAFWLAELGGRTDFNAIKRSDVTAALLRLKEKGQVQTALKRLNNLRTMYNWLVDEEGLELSNPTAGYRKLRDRIAAGYEPRRPRLTPAQMQALRTGLLTASWRLRLLFTLMLDSGIRAVQARTAMRSHLNAPLESPMPEGMAPHGWALFGAVKGQRRHLSHLTVEQRTAIDAVIAGPLAEWEGKYQAGELKDYPLVPGGEPLRLQLRPISDTALRDELKDIFAAAGIPKMPGDRKGFHMARRAWAELVRSKLGFEVMKEAGGWHNEDTAKLYVSAYDHGARDKVRRMMEEQDND
jgi:integrase